MEFYKKGLTCGLEIDCTLENGKALLEFRVQLRKAVAEEMLEESGVTSASCQEGYLDIRMWDKEDRLVFNCCHPLSSEEPARGLLLHPHLWQGTEDPYLYDVQVSLMERKDYAVDVIKTAYAFRNFVEIPKKGWFLNDRSYQIRAVEYEIPATDSMACMLNKNVIKMRLRRDLELIRRMGANTVCPVGGEVDREFCKICDEFGLLVWNRESGRCADKCLSDICGDEPDISRIESSIPRFHGTESSLLTVREHSLTAQFYFYKACWSKEPFVYINSDSLRFQKNGYARVTVYSNQRKVALYVDGTLFEFKTEGPDFLFQDIPVRKLPMMLTAEAGECSMSVTAYPFTEFSQNNHFSMTFGAYNDLS